MEDQKEPVLPSLSLNQTLCKVPLVKAVIVQNQIPHRIFKMSKEDLSLPGKMEKLEIATMKLNKASADENPFINLSQPHQRKSMSKSVKRTVNCMSVYHNHVDKHITICKRKHKKILREPILKILHNVSGVTEDNKINSCKKTLSSLTTSSGNINLSALVDNCNQLRISSEVSEKKILSPDTTRWWRKEDTLMTKKNETPTDISRSGPSCSQEALNPPCDVTIDELASYFDTLVHIPKKMSSMAEMMYI